MDREKKERKVAPPVPAILDDPQHPFSLGGWFDCQRGANVFFGMLKIVPKKTHFGK